MTYNERGSAIITEQLFVMLFGIMILVTVVVTFSNVRADTLEFTAETRFEDLAFMVHEKVVQASGAMQFSDSGNITLILPARVGNHPYTVHLTNDSIRVQSQLGMLNRTMDAFKVNSTLSGSISSTASGKYVVAYDKDANTINLTTI